MLHYVDEIGELYKHDGIIKPLWFRGQEYSHYNLAPNIFRQASYHYNAHKTYSNNHLREDYRYQHFMARNFDKADYREPHSVFEWQEIMQHFFSKTRLMDWSESLFSSLEFAMEAFLIPYKNLEISDKRRKMQPTLWILQPNGLNEKVIADMKVGVNPIAMEYMPKCQDFLYEIQLTNPRKIAEQMRKIGFKSSDLYPDMQRVAQDMENMDFSKVSNPHFKWGFIFSPSRAFLRFRQRRGFAIPLLLVAS